MPHNCKTPTNQETSDSQHFFFLPFRVDSRLWELCGISVKCRVRSVKQASCFQRRGSQERTCLSGARASEDDVLR
eukprot:6096722-Amphidinium_carterae.1